MYRYLRFTHLEKIYHGDLTFQPIIIVVLQANHCQDTIICSALFLLNVYNYYY